MGWLGAGNARSCSLFVGLMLSAVLMTCLAFAAIGALTTDTADVAALALGLMDVGEPASPSIPKAPPRDLTSVDDVSQGQAPDFTLLDLDGNQISLGDFAGQPVVINFWATWCPPCQDEMPLLVEAYQREGGQVVFLAISIDEPERAVRRFAEKNDISFVVLLDEGGKVASEYQVKSIPVTFFVSRDGQVVMRYVGQIPTHRLEDGLSRIR
jgi:peroxiredoxin